MRDSVAPIPPRPLEGGGDEGTLTGGAHPADNTAVATNNNLRRIRVIAELQLNRSRASRILRGARFVRFAVNTRSQRALL